VLCKGGVLLLGCCCCLQRGYIGQHARPHPLQVLAQKLRCMRVGLAGGGIWSVWMLLPGLQ
jgi:hypothetical protein